MNEFSTGKPLSCQVVSSRFGWWTFSCMTTAFQLLIKASYSICKYQWWVKVLSACEMAPSRWYKYHLTLQFPSVPWSFLVFFNLICFALFFLAHNLFFAPLSEHYFQLQQPIKAHCTLAAQHWTDGKVSGYQVNIVEK